MARLMSVMSLLCVLALAQPATADAPPQNAKPLSEILRTLEQQGDVAYFDEVEWDDDGYWEVEYITTGGQKREIKVDPVSGETKR